MEPRTNCADPRNNVRWHTGIGTARKTEMTRVKGAESSEEKRWEKLRKNENKTARKKLNSDWLP